MRICVYQPLAEGKRRVQGGSGSLAGALRTKEAALQALGCLGIARPQALLSREAQAAMAEALRHSSSALLKMRGLHNLAELLKAGCPARLSALTRVLPCRCAAQRLTRVQSAILILQGSLCVYWVLTQAGQLPFTCPAQTLTAERILTAEIVAYVQVALLAGCTPAWQAISHSR